MRSSVDCFASMVEHLDTLLALMFRQMASGRMSNQQWIESRALLLPKVENGFDLVAHRWPRGWASSLSVAIQLRDPGVDVISREGLPLSCRRRLQVKRKLLDFLFNNRPYYLF
jgi:hypothetical protein